MSTLHGSIFLVHNANGESLTSSPEGRHQPGGTGPDNNKIDDSDIL